MLKSSSHSITRHLKENATLYSFICVLFLMGIVFGAVIVNSVTTEQKEDLFYYLNQFFGQVIDGSSINNKTIFTSSFWHNLKFIGFIWLLGISIIGLPIILVFLFLKGLVVGFTVGFLVNQMSWKGFFLSFTTILPQNILIIPMFIFITVMAMTFSFKLIGKLLLKQTSSFHFFSLFTKYVFALSFAVVVLFFAAAIEAYISPGLLKSILQASK